MSDHEREPPSNAVMNHEIMESRKSDGAIMSLLDQTLAYYRKIYPKGAPVNLHDYEIERVLESSGDVRLEPHSSGAIICYATACPWCERLQPACERGGECPSWEGRRQRSAPEVTKG